MARVPGIDVSYWDAGIDWPKVHAAGPRFVFVKATKGITCKVSTFDLTGLQQSLQGFYAARIIFSVVMWMQKSRRIISLTRF